MKTKFGIKEVVAIGIGTALFVAMTAIQIPTPIPNTYLQPRMAVMAFIAAVFGPIVGGVIGVFGHALGDLFFYGSVWWSWVIPEAIVGVAIGIFASKYAVREGGFGVKQIVLFNIAQVIGNGLAWLLAAPLLDILIYVEPEKKLFYQGLTAFTGNIIIVGILGSLLTYGYAKIGAKSSSLSKED